MQTFIQLMRPTADWGPSLPEHRTGRYAPGNGNAGTYNGKSGGVYYDNRGVDLVWTSSMNGVNENNEGMTKMTNPEHDEIAENGFQRL